MKIKPIGHRMYIILDEFQDEVNGVKLPQTHGEQSRFATVVGIGEEVIEGGKFKVGDRVIVSYGAGIRVHLIKYNIMTDTHRIISQEEVMGMVEDEDVK